MSEAARADFVDALGFVPDRFQLEAFERLDDGEHVIVAAGSAAPGPWHVKQRSERIGRMSRLKSISSAAPAGARVAAAVIRARELERRLMDRGWGTLRSFAFQASGRRGWAGCNTNY